MATSLVSFLPGDPDSKLYLGAGALLLDSFSDAADDGLTLSYLEAESILPLGQLPGLFSGHELSRVLHLLVVVFISSPVGFSL